MEISKADVEAFLSSLGFTLNEATRLGDHYKLELPTGMQVVAWGSKAGDFFTIKDDAYREVRFSLESKGTRYKFLSLAALQANAEHVLAELLRVSRTPDLLKCPKCGIRFVHAKEPSPTDKWKPFLSCEGMMIVKKGGKKQVLCDGVSQKLPAVVTYQ